MKSFLLPLYCFAILGAQPCGAGDKDGTINPVTNVTGPQPTMTDNGSSSLSISSLGPSSPGPFTTSSTRTPPVKTGLYELLSKAECRTAALVAAGLILACAILLISTLILACKVCHLSRRLKMLNSSLDLISSSDNCAVTAPYCTAKKEAGETTVLMSDVGGTQEDVANGATKDEVKEVEASGENKKDEGGASAGESKKETPAAVASQPQEDVSSSQAGVAAASSSEEPKDVV